MDIFELPEDKDVTEIDLGNLQLKIITVTEQNKKAVIETLLLMYTNEPCRICGEMITRDDIDELVFAGYSKDDKSRAAHGECWSKNIPRVEWAYPEDEALT